jgi:hypothetical protein
MTRLKRLSSAALILVSLAAAVASAVVWARSYSAGGALSATRTVARLPALNAEPFAKLLDPAAADGPHDVVYDQIEVRGGTVSLTRVRWLWLEVFR